MLLPLGLWNSEATQRNAIFKLFEGYACWHSEHRVHTDTSDREASEIFWPCALLLLGFVCDAVQAG